MNERGDEAAEFALRGGRQTQCEPPRGVGKADGRDRDDLALVRQRGVGDTGAKTRTGTATA